MINLADLLEKFKSFKNPEDDKVIVVNCIQSITGATVRTHDVDFISDKLKLKTHPAIKNIVFIHKQKILSVLKDNIKHRPLVDII